MSEFEEFLWFSWIKGDKLFLDKESFELLGKGVCVWLSWIAGDKLFFDKESFETSGKGEFEFDHEDENISVIWFPSSIDRLLFICWSKL